MNQILRSKTKNVVIRLTNMVSETQDVVAKTKFRSIIQDVARNSICYYKNCFKIKNTRCNFKN
jgi:hypothetical protein